MNDTIAAIATAPGKGGIAVVRVSGPDAFAVAAGLSGRKPVPRRVQFVDLGVDRCLMVSFAAPASYTGEDVVEFQCHGGAVVPRRVLERCFAAGARLARRGEFTERAFLNGKLDYDQAESVLDLIEAKTDRAADRALEGLSGRRRRDLSGLYEAALAVSSELEHALDIDEGELPADFTAGVEARIADLASRMDEAIRRRREGMILRKGVTVVLAGAPNAGKSSLLNALLESDRAIVSEIPGTTRDSIEEWMDLEGWPVRLIDTAGLRETSDPIEAEGVKRARRFVEDADICLFLSDPTESPEGGLSPSGPIADTEEGRLSPSGRGSVVSAAWDKRLSLSASHVFVSTKCDLVRGEGLAVSAKTGEGLAELKREIVHRLEARLDDAVDSDSDDADELIRARALLPRDCGDLVLAGNAVRRVCDVLAAPLGAVYSSDLLDRLFSRFCVGK